jgi:hypothetical protein
MVRALILISGIILLVTSVFACYYLFSGPGLELSTALITTDSGSFPGAYIYWLLVMLAVPLGVVGLLLLIEGAITSKN